MNKMLIAIAVLSAATVTRSAAQCTLAVTATSSNLTGSYPSYTFATDNQGTAQLTGGYATLTVTPSGSCGTWSVSYSGNTYATTEYILETTPVQNMVGWFFFNDSYGAADCSWGIPANSSSPKGQSGTGSFSLTVCANPVPGTQADSLDANPGTANRFNAHTGTITISATGATATITVSNSLTQQMFADVPPGSFAFDWLNTVGRRGIYTPPSAAINGVNPCPQSPSDACPNASITRDETAQWLIRSIFGNDNFLYSTTPWFTDVPAANPYFPWIQAMRDLGITTGCTATTYCPTQYVTRAQMAVFIIQARYGESTFAVPTTTYFTDVPAGSFGYNWIERMRYDNITAGCGTNVFCPNSDVTRAQMAVWISASAYNFYLPNPVAITSSLLTLVAGGTNLPVTVTISESPNPSQPTEYLPNWSGNTPTLSVTGCTYQAYNGASAGSCTGLLTYSLASFSAGTPGTSLPALTYNFSVGPVTANHTQPVPQSLLVRWSNSAGGLPGGYDEILLPHVIRVVDQHYLNVALPANYSSPGPAYWTEIMQAGAQVQFEQTDQAGTPPVFVQDQLAAPSGYSWTSTNPDNYVTSAWPFNLLSPTGGILNPAPNLTTTPRPPRLLAFSDTVPKVNTALSYVANLAQQTNFDATHPLYYQNPVDYVAGACPYGGNDFATWPPVSSTGGWGEGMESVKLPGYTNLMPFSGSNLHTPTLGVKGLLYYGNFLGSVTTPAPVITATGSQNFGDPGWLTCPQGGCTGCPGGNCRLQVNYQGGASAVIYYTNQGVSAADSEYGWVAGYDVTGYNNTGNFSLSAYYQDDANCPFGPGNACYGSLNTSAAQGATHSNGGTTTPAVGSPILGLGGYAVFSNLTILNSSTDYYFSEYLVADSSPEGYRLRVQIGGSNGILVNCKITDNRGVWLNPDGYCSGDMSLSGSNSITMQNGHSFIMPFQNVFPDLGTRLWNQSGYVNALVGASASFACNYGQGDGVPVAPAGSYAAGFPTMSSGAGFNLQAVYIAQ
jgi:hypothetical protein